MGQCGSANNKAFDEHEPPDMDTAQWSPESDIPPHSLHIKSRSTCTNGTNSEVDKDELNRTKSDPHDKNPLLHERQLLKLLKNHPHITQFTHDPESNVYTGGSLLDAILRYERFSEPSVAILMHILLKAVAGIHSLNIAHRALKPANIMFATRGAFPNVKIIDFRSAIVLNDARDQYSDYVGTPMFMSPKAVQSTTLTADQTKAWDMWSLGIICYVLITGASPYESEDLDVLLEEISRFDVTSLFKSCSLSEECHSFLSKMLHSNPNVRYTAMQAQHDPWITQYTMPVARSDQIHLPSLWPSCIAPIASPNALMSFIVDIYRSQLSKQQQSSLDDTFDGMDSGNNQCLDWLDINRWIVASNEANTTQFQLSAQRMDDIFALMDGKQRQQKIYFDDFVECQSIALFIADPVSVVTAVLREIGADPTLIAKEATSYSVDITRLKHLLLSLQSHSAMDAANILDCLKLAKNGRVDLYDIVAIALSDMDGSIKKKRKGDKLLEQFFGEVCDAPSDIESDSCECTLVMTNNSSVAV